MKPKSILYILLLFLFTCINLFSSIALAEENQTDKGATIRGEIHDTTLERNPIQGAKVTVIASKDNKTWTTLTDENGEYIFTGLPEGSYTINATKKGYGDRIGRPTVVAAGGEIYNGIRMQKLKDNFGKNFTDGVLLHIAESIGKRYKLDTLIVKELNKSIQNELNTVMEHIDPKVKDLAEIGQFGKLGLVITMLTHPNGKAAFAKHLTETQLEDYTNFIIERRRKLHQAVVQVMTAYLDQELSLTNNQRENITESLLTTISNQNELPLLILMNNPLQKGVVKLINDELKISLDSILNETQSKIWSEIVTQKFPDNIILGGEKIDFVERTVNEGEDQNENKGDITKSKKWIRAEATLMAHRTLLGPLNKNATNRLNVVSKGVIQHYVEMEKPYLHGGPEPNFRFVNLLNLFHKYMNGTITREQAINNLESMREDYLTKRGTVKQWEDTHYHNITDHPLYQQAIEDVLSEDAYLGYRTIQKERENYRIQAARDLLVSFFDMILLLNDTQWKQIQMATQHFTIPVLSLDGFQFMLMELFITIDKNILTPWQLHVLKNGR